MNLYGSWRWVNTVKGLQHRDDETLKATTKRWKTPIIPPPVGLNTFINWFGRGVCEVLGCLWPDVTLTQVLTKHQGSCTVTALTLFSNPLMGIFSWLCWPQENLSFTVSVRLSVWKIWTHNRLLPRLRQVKLHHLTEPGSHSDASSRNFISTFYVLYVM